MAYDAAKRREGKARDAAANHASWQRLLIAKGFKRGSADWLKGRHVDPFLPQHTEPNETEKLLSQGWAAGQNEHFHAAAEDFDRLMRNLPY